MSTISVKIALIMDYQTTRSILNNYQLYPKQSLGQNFLVDERAAYSIAKTCTDSRPDIVLEIGSGLGALTEQLLKFSVKVIAVEIDSAMVDILTDRFAKEIVDDRLVVIHSDVRDLNLEELIPQDKNVAVAANIPYYCTSDIFQQLLSQLPNTQQIVLLVQQEATERLLAKPGIKIYGISAVLAHLYGIPRISFKVPANCFYPRPKVTSAVLVLTSAQQEKLLTKLLPGHKTESNDFKIDDRFLKFLKAAFAMRRKKLLNNLDINYDTSLIRDCLRKLALAENVRAEQIEPETIYQLYQMLEKED